MTAACEVCGTPTPTRDLTGQWVPAAVIGQAFIGRDIIVDRLVFSCPDCPTIGEVRP